MFILFLEARHFLQVSFILCRPLRSSQCSQHFDHNAKDGTACINNMEWDFKGNEVSEAINGPSFIEQLLYNRMG